MKGSDQLTIYRVLFVTLMVGFLMFSGCAEEETVDEVTHPEEEIVEEEEEKEEKKDEAIILDEEIRADFYVGEFEWAAAHVWANNFSDYLHDRTDGAFQMDIYCYPDDTVYTVDPHEESELEYLIMPGYWAQFYIPEVNILSLHYLWPEDKPWKVLDWVVKNGETMSVLEESYRQVGLVPLGIMFEGWMWLVANKPVETVDDLQGFNMRGIYGTTYAEHARIQGATIVECTWDDVPSYLETGQIDGITHPNITNIMDLAINDIPDYFIQANAEPYITIPAVRKDFFDGLPEEIQEEIRHWWADAVIPLAEWINERDKKQMEAILDDRPDIEVIEITGDEQNRFKESAIAAHEDLFEFGGTNAQALYEALVNDIEQAKQELGID